MDASYHEVRVHFKSDHGHELDSLNDYLGDAENVVTRATNVEKNDSCAEQDRKHQEVIEPKEKVAPTELVEFNIDHKTENDLACSKCDKIMRTKFTLRRHIRQAHENEDQFNCLCCDRSFCAKFSLTYHINKKHLSLFGKHFDCEKCGETLSDFQASIKLFVFVI